MQLKQQSEPSVRITVSIPNDAVNRLRQLAAEGSQALRAIGILGVQLEGDPVISLKLAGQDVNVKIGDHVGNTPTVPCMANDVGEKGQFDGLSQLLGNGAPMGSGSAFFQQHLRTTNAGVVLQQQKQQEILQQQRRNFILGGPSTSSAAQQALVQRQQQSVSGFNAVGSTTSIFKSPNTICPMEGKVPLPPQALSSAVVVPPNVRDFPFESMRQARVLQGRGQDSNGPLCGGPTTPTGVLPIQQTSSPLLTQAHNPAQCLQSQTLSGGTGAPPNVALKVVKNPQSGEILTTIAGGATPSSAPQFLQPPPPPYPGAGNGMNTSQTTATANITNSHNAIKSVHQTQSFMSQATASGSMQQTNNIAISSPLLVNLLQNDGNTSSVGSSSNQPMKPLPTSQQPTVHLQQHSPLNNMSPNTHQQHLVNSPMREFVLHQPQSKQISASPETTNHGAICVPSSPTSAGGTASRNMQQSQSQGQQQVMLSPNNMYPQQRFHQQQVTPQQVAILRHQQLQRQQQLHQKGAINSLGGSSPQRFIQQSQTINTTLNQMRQVRPTVNNLQHQAAQQQQSQFMNNGGISPVAHSPASSHHSSMHSPLAIAAHQQVLSPSTTPVQSPHHHSNAILPQQLQTPPMLPSPISSQVPPASNAILPPPPDYSQTASARWPGLNKPMDSVTKSSFQEFTRYQMQYNLQQQMNSSHQQQMQQPPQAQPLSHSPQLQSPNNANTKPIDVAPSNSSNIVAPSPVAELDASSTPGSGVLPDALMSLSDLDALLPSSFSCDLDSTLSLEDKNELESLLQDAKDLDLDLISDELSAVGVDISDAAAATALIEEEVSERTSAVDVRTNNLENTMQQSLQQTTQPTFISQKHCVLPQGLPRQQQDIVNNSEQHSQLCSHSTISGKLVRSASAASSSSTASVATTQKQLIINPLTGELEPMPSDDSETEAEQETQHLMRPSVAVMPATPSVTSTGSFMANEALPHMLFSAEEDSNSCSTAISKISDHNGLTLIGSDPERSRDSQVSNKSASRSKGVNKTIQMMNKANMADINSLPVTGAHSLNYSLPVAAGGISVLPTKKTKSTLLREKLQQGVRERKKDNTGTKAKRERSKGSNKNKTATIAALASSSGTQPITTVASIAETSATNEKIKMRLKIEKAEPISPAYKVDVTFVPSPKVANQSGDINNMTSSSDTDKNTPMTASNPLLNSTSLAGSTIANTGSTSQAECLVNTQIHAKSAVQPQYSSHQLTIQTLNNFNLPSTITVGATTTSPPISSPSVVSAYTGSAEEPRVPPLHISLRGGKNSIVIKTSRNKERKKTQPSVVHSDVEEDTKSKPMKRTISVASSTDTLLAETEIEGSDVKHPKLHTQSGLNMSVAQYNGSLETYKVSNNDDAPSVNSLPGGNIGVSQTTAILANKNGLTISTMSTLQNMEVENKSIGKVSTSSVLASTAGNTIVSASNTVTASSQGSTLPHLLKKQQFSKTPANLPSSITLSTVSSNSTAMTSHRVIANLQLKNALKSSAATITPIVTGSQNTPGFGAGKPTTKNHKPPSYLAAVQQLQLQKQQQQQMAALAEKQTHQQMLAAAAQILPSATTLKRVEINSLTKKIESHEVITPETVTAFLSTSKSVTEAAGSNLAIKAINETCDIVADKQHTVLSVTSVPTKTTFVSKSNVANVELQGVKTEVGTPKVKATLTGGVISIGSITLASPSPVVSTSTVVSPVLRNSSAGNGGHVAHGTNNSSAGGGEDSGIESMDALSEKSPHQPASSSPAQQQGQGNPTSTNPVPSIEPSSSKISNLPTTNEPIQAKSASSNEAKHSNEQPVVCDDDIEKALAKMEGHPEETTTAIKSSFQKNLDSGLSTLNGERVSLQSCALNVKLKDESDDDIIKNLTHISNASDTKSELATDARAIISEKTSIKQFAPKLEEEANVSNEPNKIDPKNMHEFSNSVDTKLQEENVSKEFDKIDTKNISNLSQRVIEKDEEIETNPIRNSPKLKCCKEVSEISGQESIKDCKTQSTVLQPISIDIPAATDLDTRIRTRSSSRLESPLEQMKTVSSLVDSTDTIVSEHIATAPKQIVGRTVGTERVTRPKTPLPSAGPNVLNVNSPSVAYTHNSKDPKRKRAETDSGELLEGKRIRSTNLPTVKSVNSKAGVCLDAVLAVDAVVSNNPEATSSGIEAEKMPQAPNITAKKEESSDSDEPLIEVAGKVRNTKPTASSASATISANNPDEDVSAPATENSKEITSESKTENELCVAQSNAGILTMEKSTRASNRAHNAANPKSNAVSTNAIPITSASAVNIAQSSSNVVNSTASAAFGLRGAKTVLSSPINSVLLPNSTIASITTITATSCQTNIIQSSSAPSPTTVSNTLSSNLTAVHATRGATHSATTSIGGTPNNNNNNAVNSSGIPLDEKIGTRRSVRASAAANKIIYSRSNVTVAAAAQNVESKSTAGDARRKTRSAVVGEALLNESRRRRGSRDFK